MRRALLALLLALPGLAGAAASGQPITPWQVSVLGGERQVFSALFTDSMGRPAAGETVTFSNDACGTFENGFFSTTVTADANGVASVTFTARPQGITCVLVADAGYRVRFSVYTYTLPMVTLLGSTFPAEPRPGQPIAFTAKAVAGAYPVYGAKPTIRVIPQDAAAVSELSTAGDGESLFSLARVGTGAFEVEIAYRGMAKRVEVAAIESPLQDMWWAGQEENGWGMSLVQHGSRFFAAIYAYDASGAPTWYVMPGGHWAFDGNSFGGPLYSPRGTPYSAYDASRLAVGPPVGSVALAFNATNDITLTYEIGGVRGSKKLMRQQFGLSEQSAAPVKAGDMWWGGPSQNGWGVALLQQHRTIFGVWFTYDADGAPTWFVMPSGFWLDSKTWEGRIYRTRGSPWLGQAYDASRLSSVDAGAFSLRFDGDSATMSYTVDGRSGTLALTRQPF